MNYIFINEEKEFYINIIDQIYENITFFIHLFHPSKARYTHTEMRIKQNPNQTRSEKKTTKHIVVKPPKCGTSKNIERYK